MGIIAHPKTRQHIQVMNHSDPPIQLPLEILIPNISLR